MFCELCRRIKFAAWTAIAVEGWTARLCDDHARMAGPLVELEPFGRPPAGSGPEQLGQVLARLPDWAPNRRFDPTR